MTTDTTEPQAAAAVPEPRQVSPRPPRTEGMPGQAGPGSDSSRTGDGQPAGTGTWRTRVTARTGDTTAGRLGTTAGRLGAIARRTAPSAPLRTPAAAPTPSPQQLLAVCGWAAVLGLVGMLVGAWGLILILGGQTPGWFEPTLVIVGLCGVALCVGAFLTVHQRLVPRLLLGAASATLICALILDFAA